MTLRRLLQESLRFYGRAHLGVLLGAMLATAILAGALAVGDSVRASLHHIALARLGKTQLALHGQNRFFRAALADGLTAELNAPVAPLTLLRGTATFQPAAGGDAVRVGQVQVVGADARFWQLGEGSPPASQEGVLLSRPLADKLGAKVGEEVLLRVDKPSLLSRDAPLSTVADASVPLRLPVTGIVDDAQFGRFSLEANQIPPANAFVPLATLQKAMALREKANVLLVGGKDAKGPTAEAANAAVWKRWDFSDAGLELRTLAKTMELRTERVFLDPPVGEAAKQATPDAQPILTYFVNALEAGGRSTPYSTVAALQGPLIPAGMQENEILINAWLAEDLQAKPGDSLTLRYWVMGPLRRLEERTSTFRIRAILPLTGEAADPALMPPIPGLADKKNCRDWEPGVPVDLAKIRDKDQAYWSRYRGTPKAFLTLTAGQKIWNNRFGDLTAVRYPLTSPQAKATVESGLRKAINPATLGLYFTPVRAQALAASSQAQDFGGLFIGFSFFLIVAALLLTALLFAFNAEQRAEEVGTLLAVGWTPRQVQRYLLAEGAAIAAIAAVIGTCLATLYTRAVIYGLGTVWRGAVANSALQYHAEPGTLLMGAVLGFLTALFAIWLVTRRQARVPARELLHAGAESETRLLASPGQTARGLQRPGLRTCLVTLIGALALILTTPLNAEAAERFFMAGSLLLIAGIAACRMLLATLNPPLSLSALGTRNSTRRVGRSLSAIGLLACGSFLVIAVGANRHDPQAEAIKRSSGTGGFALFGVTTLPLYEDLNTPSGRETYNLDGEELAGVSFVPMRLRKGDEASCLNLNRAQVPNLLGVAPEALRSRNPFTFTQSLEASGGVWNLLERPQPDGAIPVIGDTNTVVWSLGKSLKETLSLMDDQGRPLKLRIVGVTANSILQGHLLMSEENFIRHFPSQSGYQVFLIDAPVGTVAALSKTLTHALEDVGLDLTPTGERLAAFQTVENTYLSIFAVLGGLGLLLGSVGLGVLALRNVLERRSELALMRAVGFRVQALHWLVFSEHALLLALGLGVGVVAALVAVLPALRTPGAEVPTTTLALLLLSLLTSGVFFTWLATRFALRGPLLVALRNE